MTDPAHNFTSEFRRIRLASPPQRAALPLKSFTLSATPRIADEDHLYDFSSDHVEELVSTPTSLGGGFQGMSRGPSPITLATEFGHMTGHRMSVASIASDAASGGDDLPGAKARRILGIKTSSGFEDAELDDDGTSRGRTDGGHHAPMTPRSFSFRSHSPSFLTAVRGVVRRGSTRTPSLASTATTVDDDDGYAGSHVSDDCGGALKRRPSFSNLFGLTTPREQLRRTNEAAVQNNAHTRARSNSVDVMPHSSLPHYRKARTLDPTQQDATATTPTTPTAVEWMLGPQSSAVQETRHRRFASAGDVYVPPSIASDALRGANSVDSWRAYDADDTSASSSTRASSDLPSLVGDHTHDGSHRSGSPSSVWSCETGSSMSWDALMTRSSSSIGHAAATPESLTVSPPTRQSSLARRARPMAQLSTATSAVPPSLPPVALLSWSNSSPLSRRAAIGRPRALHRQGGGTEAVSPTDDDAFAKPRRAPKPPTATASQQQGENVCGGRYAQLEAKQLPAAPYVLPACDDVYVVSRNNSAYTDTDSSPSSSSNSLASLIPSYYLRSPSMTETDYTVVIGNRPEESRDEAVFVGDDVIRDDDDDQMRAVLQASSEDELRTALSAPAPSCKSPSTEGQTIDTVATPDDSPTLAMYRRSTEATPVAMTVPVDEEAEQQELLAYDAGRLSAASASTTAASESAAAGSASFDYDCPDARRSIEDALDSIILDLPARSATLPTDVSTKPLPLRIDVTKKTASASCASPRSMLPLKSPLRSKPKYFLPIS